MMVLKRIFGLILCISSFVAMAEQNLDRDFCRNHANEAEMIECVKQGIYDPCDDASGSRGWWSAQCAWAHFSIADKKVSESEEEISCRLGGSKEDSTLLKTFLKSQAQWKTFRETYCNFTGSIVDSESFDGDSSYHVGFCLRRVTEQRAAELNGILSGKEPCFVEMEKPKINVTEPALDVDNANNQRQPTR